MAGRDLEALTVRLVLSSAAAPGRSLGELLDAAERKAVAGLELETGHGHGVGPALEADALERVRDTFRERGLTLAGLRLGPSLPSAEVIAAASRALGAPLILRGVAGAESTSAEALERGAALLFAFGAGDADVAGAVERVERLRAVHGEAVGFAWNGRPSLDPAGQVLGAFARRTDVMLRHVRIQGAGPDGGDPGGGSVGALMGRLTLARFDGTCALAPASDVSLPAWDAWLGRRRGWGCNGERPVRIAVRGGGCGCH